MSTAAERFHEWDMRTCTTVNRWAWHRWLRAYFVAVSRIGDGWAWYALIAGVALWGGEKSAQAALHLAAAAVFSLLLYKTMKRFTKRPRPFARHPHIVPWTAALDEFSFPSGHTLHAVTLSIIAVHYLPVLAVVLVPLAMSIALSRLVLGMHYPSDVLAASMIGAVIAGGSIFLMG